MMGIVSTHSRLKAAGMFGLGLYIYAGVSTHSRLKAAGSARALSFSMSLFQHTAA